MGKISKEQVKMAGQTIKKVSDTFEKASSALYTITKSGNSVAQRLPFSDEQIEQFQNIEDSVGMVENIAKFFNKNQEGDFYRTSIPFILEQSGFDKDSRIHKVATSKMAGKAASFLKPVALSILSYYARKNGQRLPEENPFKMQEYPSLLDNDASSVGSETDSKKRSSSADEQDWSCLTNSRILTECLDFSEKECDRQISKITEPIEDNLVKQVNKQAAKYTMSDEEYKTSA